jgi:hypothetical protein
LDWLNDRLNVSAASTADPALFTPRFDILPHMSHIEQGVVREALLILPTP